MVDNQHREIKGYRDLTPFEIELINEIKRKATEVKELTMKLNDMGAEIDQRWNAIAVTDLQKGFMGLVRAVAQPEGF